MDFNEKKIRIEINQELNKIIKITDSNDNVKYILNKNNPYADLDESFKDLEITS